MEVRDTLAHLLPKTIALRFEACHLDDAPTQITLIISSTLMISSTQVEVRCPACEVPARHLHSHCWLEQWVSQWLASLPDDPQPGLSGPVWHCRVVR